LTLKRHFNRARPRDFRTPARQGDRLSLPYRRTYSSDHAVVFEKLAGNGANSCQIWILSNEGLTAGAITFMLPFFKKSAGYKKRMLLWNLGVWW
jgi:hypothetical protein